MARKPYSPVPRVGTFNLVRAADWPSMLHKAADRYEQANLIAGNARPPGALDSAHKAAVRHSARNAAAREALADRYGVDIGEVDADAIIDAIDYGTADGVTVAQCDEIMTISAILRRRPGPQRQNRSGILIIFRLLRAGWRGLCRGFREGRIISRINADLRRIQRTRR